MKIFTVLTAAILFAAPAQAGQSRLSHAQIGQALGEVKCGLRDAAEVKDYFAANGVTQARIRHATSHGSYFAAYRNVC